MNPRVVLSVSVLAILGLVFRVTPGGTDGSTKSSAPASAPAEKASDDKKPEKVDVEDLGPWVATCRYFGELPVLPKAPLTARQLFCIPDSALVETMVATIPDPAHSRLGYFSDRAIESLIRGAQRAGWAFDSAVLPWKCGRNPYGENAWVDRQREDPQPGVIVFRKDGHLLLSLIAGETPTSGINVGSLNKAFVYAADLASDQGTDLPVVGPTFSGSVPSLIRVIECFAVPLNIWSGTLTSETSVEKLVPLQPTVNFHRATYSDVTTRERLVDAARFLGIRDDEVTILAEEETIFGELNPDPDPQKRSRFRRISFPRDISSLRNTYREATATTPTPGVAAPHLPFTLHDSDGGDDSAPILARAYTPQSQYASLDATMEELGARTKLVEIVATNVLDSLFLARMIHEAAPGTRILVPDADRLFVRAAREQGLTSVLALTPNPVFGVEYQYTSSFAFAASDTVGIFNATVAALIGPGSSHFSAAGNYSNLQSRPTQENSPPIWLAEATPTGYWPLQVFGGKPGDMAILRRSAAAFQLPYPLYPWWVLNGLVCLGCVLLTIFVACGQESNKRRFHLFAPLPSESMQPHAARSQRLWFIQAAIAAAAAGLLCVNLPLAADNLGHLPLVLCLITTAVLIFALFAVSYRAAEREAAFVLRLTHLAWGVAALIASALFVWGTHTGVASFIALRSLAVASGASPILPLLLVLGGIVLGAIVHLRRVSLAFERNPGVPGAESPAIDKTRLLHYWNATCKIWTLCGDRFGIVEWLLVILVPLTAVFSRRFIRSANGVIWTFTFIFLAAILLLTLVWSATLFYRGWKRLRLFLRDLDSMPLDGAFQRLPPQFSTSPMWKGSPARRNFDVFFRGVECLRELSLLCPSNAELPKHLTDLTNAGDLIYTSERDCSMEDYSTIAQAATQTAEYLAAEALLPAWKHGVKDPASNRSGPPSPTATPLTPVYILASEFVALRYAAGIRYMMMQLRNLIWFISGGFLLFALALNTFDPQSPEVLRWFVTVVFALVSYLVIIPLMQMERETIIRLMADSPAGEKNTDFLKFATYGIAPLFGLLSTYFPSLSSFLFSWLQPTLETLK